MLQNWGLIETYIHKFRFKCSLEWAMMRCDRRKEMGFVGDPVGVACDHVWDIQKACGPGPPCLLAPSPYSGPTHTFSSPEKVDPLSLTPNSNHTPSKCFWSFAIVRWYCWQTISLIVMKLSKTFVKKVKHPGYGIKSLHPWMDVELTFKEFQGYCNSTVEKFDSIAFRSPIPTI